MERKCRKGVEKVHVTLILAKSYHSLSVFHAKFWQSCALNERAVTKFNLRIKVFDQEPVDVRETLLGPQKKFFL